MIKQIYKKCVRHKWEIGFIENSIEDILNGEHLNIWWVEHEYTDRWFADPFILKSTNETIVLLVEEYYDPIKMGRIVKLTIDKKSHRIISNELVLQLNTHLSFPAISHNNDKIYIYPENYQSGDLNLYEFNEITNECTFVKNIIHQPLTDAIINKIGEDEYLFSTKEPNPNGKLIEIFKNIDGNFKLIQKYEFPENIARNAGEFFRVNEKLYRVAQESNDTYGHSISIQEVLLKDNIFDFSEKIRIPSPHPKHRLGFHTFNVYNDMIVIDVKGFRHPFIGRFCYALKHLIGLP